MPKHEESLLQSHFCNWLSAMGYLYNASLAGVNLGPRVGKLRKAMGSRRGFPDVFIYMPRGKFYGLAIEIKVKGGDIKDEYQLAWQKALNEQGYCAVIAPNNLNFSDAFNWLRDLVERYMRGECLLT